MSPVRYDRNKGSVRAAVLLTILVLALAACAKQTHTPRGATAVTTEVQAEVAGLDRLAEETEQLTKQGKTAEARIRLNTLGEKMVATSFTGVSGVEGIRSLSDAILTAQRAYNQARFSEAEALAAIGRVRLITDAMLRPEHPVWHQAYKLLKDDAELLEKNASQGDLAAVKTVFRDWSDRYQGIRPAVLVRTPAEKVEKLDSLTVFLAGRIAARETGATAFLEAVKQLDQGIDELFGRREDRTAYLPLAATERPLLWTFGIGTLLTAVLSFVAWRMYHTDKRLARVHRDELHRKG
ncbi:sporulation protein YpjB [Gorillibacterium sp. sgz500922]|uniref:sporulation protein YpjB n=1 Tax=Gorillibacterium sp. sgz500922 TaxID=3446694 RepID=UPI003F66FC88